MQMTKSRRTTGWIVTLAGLLLAGWLARPARADLDPRQVSEAIDRAVAYLKRVQGADGSWPDFAANEGGVTSLCTLALLSAGGEAGRCRDPEGAQLVGEYSAQVDVRHIAANDGILRRGAENDSRRRF